MVLSMDINNRVGTKMIVNIQNRLQYDLKIVFGDKKL